MFDFLLFRFIITQKAEFLGLSQRARELSCTYTPEFNCALLNASTDPQRASTLLHPTKTEFNRAMFFRTSDPGGPFHRVAPVTKKAMDAGWRRFGYTGWYTVEKKGRSDEEIKNIIRNNLGGVDLLYATEEERAELAQDPLLA